MSEDLEKQVKALQEQIEALTKRVTLLEGSGDSHGASRGTQESKVPRPKSARADSTGRAGSFKGLKPFSGIPAKKKEEDSKEELVDSSRVGQYMVGKRKVYYVVPSSYNGDEKSEAQPPSTDLKLEYIYGYNGKNTRNNLFFVDADATKLLYNIAATSVFFDTTTNTQSFFVGHDEDILSLAKHPTKPIAASGQLDPKGNGKPYVVIWNYEEMKQLYRIEGYHDRGVIALQFTPDGKYLYSIGNDDSHSLAVWDWENDRKRPVAEATVSKDEVYGLTFNVHNKEGYEFATYGVKHFKLWTMRPNKEESKGSEKHKYVLNGVLVSAYKKTKEIQKAHTCAAFLSTGECVAGTLTGDLYVFKDKDYDRSVKAHTGTIGALAVTDDGIASSGVDGKILLFKTDLTPAGEFKFATDEKKAVPSALDFAKGRLAIGTVRNDIVLLDVGSGDAKTVMEGHSDEFWGLAVHPTEPVIVTGSNDHTIRAWNTATKTAIAGKVRKFEKDEVHGVAFSPDGKTVAAGFKSGRVALIDFDTFEVQYEKKFRKEQIDSIAFSPDGKYLAFGSWDQIAEVVNLESKSSIILKGHTSSLTHLTWSADSKYLSTNSRDYEILYWDVESGKRVERNAMADVQWGEWTNILGWPVKGIFKKGMDGTDINAANISGDNNTADRFVATGDDSGKVTLYRYPVIGKDPQGKEYGGHSSHVTNVRFSKDGKTLFSAGGLDTGLFQWNNA